MVTPAVDSDDTRSTMSSDVSSTRELLQRFKSAVKEAHGLLQGEEYQRAMALYFDASQSADEMCERFFTLLMRTAPSDAHRVLLVELLSWRLRYLTAQHQYHLAVAKTLTGLPREEWIARVETIVILSQSLVAKLLPALELVGSSSLGHRIRSLLADWTESVRDLVTNLRNWGLASAQAARVLEWAIDNRLVGDRT